MRAFFVKNILITFATKTVQTYKKMNEKEIMKLISDTLKEKKITNYSIAKKMRKSKTTITKWFTGITYPDLPDLIVLLTIAEINLILEKN